VSATQLAERPAADAEDGQPLLLVRDLTTAFDTAAGPFRAVDGVSFDLHRGGSLGIVGESGSGKTVLTRTIMNLLPRQGVARSGTVRFDGHQIERFGPKQMRHLWGAEMGLILQDPMTSLNPVMTIGHQLVEPLRIHAGFTRSRARAVALETLRSVGMPAPEKRMGEYPHQLSGGMRQRVTIAISLVCGPKLVVADEPTTALDVTVQRQILELLADQQQDRRMALLMITHDLGVVANRTDEILVMYAGRVVERAPTRALFREHRHPYTQGLLRSIPRLADPSHHRLQAIPGSPPDLTNLAAGCAFAPRCPAAQPRCVAEAPPLVPQGSGHEVACHFPVGTPEGDRARAENVAAGRSATGAEVTA